MLQGTRADRGTLMAKLAALAPSASFPFDLLYSWAWDSVSDSTKSLPMVTSFFPATIPQEVLSAASGLGPHLFSGALEQALQFNRFERAMGRQLLDAHEHKCVHPRATTTSVGKRGLGSVRLPLPRTDPANGRARATGRTVLERVGKRQHEAGRPRVEDVEELHGLGGGRKARASRRFCHAVGLLQWIIAFHSGTFVLRARRRGAGDGSRIAAGSTGARVYRWAPGGSYRSG